MDLMNMNVTQDIFNKCKRKLFRNEITYDYECVMEWAILTEMEVTAWNYHANNNAKKITSTYWRQHNLDSNHNSTDRIMDITQPNVWFYLNIYYI